VTSRVSYNITTATIL